MRLYLDLAMRLLWGSRLNASTRMTALLALGILTATAFGVVVVGLINQGFSDILHAELDRSRATPPFAISLTRPLPRSHPTAAAVDRKVLQIQQEFMSALPRSSPPEWVYRSTLGVLIPEANLQKALSATRHIQAQSPAPIGPDEIVSPADRRDRKALMSALTETYHQQMEQLRVTPAVLCSSPGQGPQNLNEVWVSRTWGRIGQPLGSQWVLMQGSNANDLRSKEHLPIHKKVWVIKLAPLHMRGLNCSIWVAPKFMDVIARRKPEDVRANITWANESDVPQALLKRWFPQDNFTWKQGKQLLLWGVLVQGQEYGAVDEGAAKILGVQRLVSWLVVGMMCALAIYQVCSLLMMLGLQFRFDVALLRSLGMARWRVMMVFVVSSIVLMSIGLGVGMSVAWWWLPHMNDTIAWGLTRMDAQDLIDWVPWTANASFVWRAFGVGLVLGVVAGMIPAWMASRAKPSDIWKQEA